jgi:LysM repeat protein
MQTKPHPLWIIVMLLVTSFTLAACVRPYPGGEQTEPQVVPQLIVTPQGIVPAPTLTTPGDELATPEPLPIEPEVEQPEPTAMPPAADTIHTVVAGDTLFKIALQYDVDIAEITAVNDIPDINRLEIGQQILIPAPGSVVDGSEATPEPSEPTAPTQSGGTHVVQPGENLFRIGLQYGCSVSQMAAANGIVNPTYIYVGQELTVPACN